MTEGQKSWFTVLGTGAASAAVAVAAGPLTVTTGALALLAFFVGAGGAAKGISITAPRDRKPNARGQVADDEDPR